MWDPPVKHPHLCGHVHGTHHQHPSLPLPETNSNNCPCSVLLPLLAMMSAVEQPRAHQMPGTLSSSSRHGTTHRARHCELEASALSSPASPLRPDKAAFLRRTRAASSMGGGHGGGDGLDGHSHGGEDGLDKRRPRGRARRTRWAASMRRGRAARSASAATSTRCEGLGGDLDAASAVAACTHHMSHTPPRSLVIFASVPYRNELVAERALRRWRGGLPEYENGGKQGRP
jgi:hypothetical protein